MCGPVCRHVDMCLEVVIREQRTVLKSACFCIGLCSFKFKLISLEYHNIIEGERKLRILTEPKVNNVIYISIAFIIRFDFDFMMSLYERN